MEHNIQLLIEKLWQGSLSPAEAKLLHDALQLADGQKEDAVQAHFRKLYTHDTGTNWQNKNSEVILKRIMETISTIHEPKKKQLLKRHVAVWWSAAAIIAIGLAVLLKINVGSNLSKNNQLASELTNLRTITNRKDGKMNIKIPDGSVIELSSGSTVSFSRTFDEKERLITLKGTAKFIVAKDHKRKFTVFSGNLATTALGTIFSVATKRPGFIEVKLYEGKVKLENTNRSLGKKPIYMKPGQLVDYDQLTASHHMTTFTLTRTKDIIPLVAKKRSSAIPKVAPAQLRFDNAPLDKVFTQLSARYHIIISYDKPAMEGLYFTGTVEKTDSLSTVLAVISTMNGLKLNQINGKITITK